MRKVLLAAAGAGLLVSLVPTAAHAGCWTPGGPWPTPQVCVLPDEVTDLLK